MKAIEITGLLPADVKMIEELATLRKLQAASRIAESRYIPKDQQKINPPTQPVGERLGKSIRKHPTAITTPQHSVVLKRLYGITAPPIHVDRPLGYAELNQKLLHLGNNDLVPRAQRSSLGVPVSMSFPQIGVKFDTKIVGQFRFGKGSRKSKPFEKLFKAATHKSVIIKEVVTGEQAEFVVLFY